MDICLKGKITVAIDEKKLKAAVSTPKNKKGKKEKISSGRDENGNLNPLLYVGDTSTMSPDLLAEQHKMIALLKTDELMQIIFDMPAFEAAELFKSRLGRTMEEARVKPATIEKVLSEISGKAFRFDEKKGEFYFIIDNIGPEMSVLVRQCAKRFIDEISRDRSSLSDQVLKDIKSSVIAQMQAFVMNSVHARKALLSMQKELMKIEMEFSAPNGDLPNKEKKKLLVDAFKKYADVLVNEQFEIFSGGDFVERFSDELGRVLGDKSIGNESVSILAISNLMKQDYERFDAAMDRFLNELKNGVLNVSIENWQEDAE
jgi:hypothetical protein